LIISELQSSPVICEFHAAGHESLSEKFQDPLEGETSFFCESPSEAIDQSGRHNHPFGGKPTMAPQRVNMGAPLGADESMGMCRECHTFPQRGVPWNAEQCSDDGNFWRWTNNHFPKDQLVKRVPHACCFQCVVSSLWPERTQREGRRHGHKCTQHHGSHNPADGAQSSTGTLVSGRMTNFPVQSRLVGFSTGALQITNTTAEDVVMTELSTGITALSIDK